MTPEINFESALLGLEYIAAFCIGVGLLLGFFRKVVSDYPSRLGVWIMLFGALLLALMVALDRLL
jgi:hypothetical protein